MSDRVAPVSGPTMLVVTDPVVTARVCGGWLADATTRKASSVDSLL